MLMICCFLVKLSLVSKSLLIMQMIILHHMVCVSTQVIRVVTCTIFGKNTLSSDPSWVLNESKLNITDSITYLGVVMSNDPKPNLHYEERICKRQKAFYSLHWHV